MFNQETNNSNLVVDVWNNHSVVNKNRRGLITRNEITNRFLFKKQQQFRIFFYYYCWIFIITPLFFTAVTFAAAAEEGAVSKPIVPDGTNIDPPTLRVDSNRQVVPDSSKQQQQQQQSTNVDVTESYELFACESLTTSSPSPSSNNFNSNNGDVINKGGQQQQQTVGSNFMTGNGGSIKVTQKQESLQLGQFGRIWPYANNNKTDKGKFFMKFPRDALCKLELVACPNCLIQLAWKTANEKSRENFKFNLALRQQCDKPRDFGDMPCLGVNIVEESADRFYSYKSFYRKVSILLDDEKINNNPNTNDYINFQNFLNINRNNNNNNNRFANFLQNNTQKSLPENQQNSKNDSSATTYNGNYGHFLTTTYKIELTFYSWRVVDSDDIFSQINDYLPIEFKVLDNSITRHGRPSHDFSQLIESDGYVQSPRFPKSYPEGVLVNYTLINDDPGGLVRLTFSDFQLHFMSTLQIFDSDGSQISTTMMMNNNGQQGALSSASVRPCAVQSLGPKLIVVFSANHYSHEIGFRAHYKFVAYDESWLDKPICKPCDKLLDDKGGYMSVDSVDVGPNAYMDCIWVLTKSRFGLPYEKIYVKVEELSAGADGKSVQLEIRRGLSSVSPVEFSMFGPKTKEQLARAQPQEGFVVDLQDQSLSGDYSEDRGFYIRLRGYPGSYNGVGVTYARFYKWATAMCHDGNEFHCDNGRCILSKFLCDNHDHCGDYSDEVKERCADKKSANWDSFTSSRGGGGGGGNRPPDSSELYDQDVYSRKYPLNYTTTLLLVAGLIGLTMVMLMVTVVVARVYRRRLIRRLAAFRRTHADLSTTTSSSNGGGNGGSPHRASYRRSQSSEEEQQTGSRPGPSIHQVGNRRLLVLPESNISVFEAPPTYDDALKHPTVPPDCATIRSSFCRRGGQQLQTAATPTAAAINNSGTVNPTFINDAGHLVSHVTNTGDVAAAAAGADQSLIVVAERLMENGDRDGQDLNNTNVGSPATSCITTGTNDCGTQNDECHIAADHQMTMSIGSTSLNGGDPESENASPPAAAAAASGSSAPLTAWGAAVHLPKLNQLVNWARRRIKIVGSPASRRRGDASAVYNHVDTDGSNSPGPSTSRNRDQPNQHQNWIGAEPESSEPLDQSFSSGGSSNSANCTQTADDMEMRGTLV